MNDTINALSFLLHTVVYFCSSMEINCLKISTKNYA